MSRRASTGDDTRRRGRGDVQETGGPPAQRPRRQGSRDDDGRSRRRRPREPEVDRTPSPRRAEGRRREEVVGTPGIVYLRPTHVRELASYSYNQYALFAQNHLSEYGIPVSAFADWESFRAKARQTSMHHAAMEVELWQRNDGTVMAQYSGHDWPLRLRQGEQVVLSHSHPWVDKLTTLKVLRQEWDGRGGPCVVQLEWKSWWGDLEDLFKDNPPESVLIPLGHRRLDRLIDPSNQNRVHSALDGLTQIWQDDEGPYVNPLQAMLCINDLTSDEIARVNSSLEAHEASCRRRGQNQPLCSLCWQPEPMGGDSGGIRWPCGHANHHACMNQVADLLGDALGGQIGRAHV